MAGVVANTNGHVSTDECDALEESLKANSAPIAINNDGVTSMCDGSLQKLTDNELALKQSKAGVVVASDAKTILKTDARSEGERSNGKSYVEAENGVAISTEADVNGDGFAAIEDQNGVLSVQDGEGVASLSADGRGFVAEVNGSVDDGIGAETSPGLSEFTKAEGEDALKVLDSVLDSVSFLAICDLDDRLEEDEVPQNSQIRRGVKTEDDLAAKDGAKNASPSSDKTDSDYETITDSGSFEQDLQPLPEFAAVTAIAAVTATATVDAASLNISPNNEATNEFYFDSNANAAVTAAESADAGVAAAAATAEKKSVKKKKSASAEECVSTTKVKKTKKNKKVDEKENISVLNGHESSHFHQIVDDTDELSKVCVRDLKLTYTNEANKRNNNKLLFAEEPVRASIPIKELRSSFGKFDQLSKKPLLHVRSSDSAKAQQHFSQKEEGQENGSACKACAKTVFAMEQINAERHVWHKNCFRCKSCNKQLTVDIYSSHEGELYCKPHFRDLFKPKVVVEEEDQASDKPDLGLEELSSLNVKSRYQVFEKSQVEDNPTEKALVNVKRSPSIMSRLAKFQSKGMDIGVSVDIMNGINYEESSSSEEEGENERDGDVTKCSIEKEKPVAFVKLDDVKKNWENGQSCRREERREEKLRQELQSIRSRLFMGKQNKMKEAYEQAVADSEKVSAKKDIDVRSEKARTIKEKFEKGEVLENESDDEGGNNKRDKSNEEEILETDFSKQSRSMFQQLDANAVKKIQQMHVQNSTEIRKKESHPDGLSEEDEPPKNPNVVREEDDNDDAVQLRKSNTASKMLSIFRQMEGAQENIPKGPKPLKEFTPPPQSPLRQFTNGDNSEDDSEEESDERSDSSDVDGDIVKSSHKVEDEFLKQAQTAERAKALKEKFEHWQPEQNSNNSAINLLDGEQASIDTTKSLRARFESLRAEQPAEKARPKVNRFVGNSLTGYCDTCHKKVYPLEKVEAGGKQFHRNCFKCIRCQNVLRMESFTMNNGNLYCLTHFKQLFIAKGNYDEGFGVQQHKKNWSDVPPVVVAVAIMPRMNGNSKN